MKTPKFWHRDGWLSRLLIPASYLYRLAMRARWRYADPDAVGVPIICVGNATVGGAGKTPVALAIGEMLKARGIKAHFLSKGYGGSLKGPVRVNETLQTAAEVGDEPLLLSRVATCWVAKNRVAGADVAVSGGAETLVMDDGLQNPKINRTFSFLVIDGGYGIGNGRLIPAGPLREPIETAIDRADAIVIVGKDAHNIKASLPASHPVLHAMLRPRPEDAERLKGKRVAAFAGIARPEKFFKTLKTIGCEVVSESIYPDHYPFKPTDLEQLIGLAKRQDACLITTEKDAVRIPDFYRKRLLTLPITIHWREPDRVWELLAPLVAGRARTA